MTKPRIKQICPGWWSCDGLVGDTPKGAYDRWVLSMACVKWQPA